MENLSARLMEVVSPGFPPHLFIAPLQLIYELPAGDLLLAGRSISDRLRRSWLIYIGRPTVIAIATITIGSNNGGLFCPHVRRWERDCVTVQGFSKRLVVWGEVNPNFQAVENLSTPAACPYLVETACK
jgi:hypothetical protein